MSDRELEKLFRDNGIRIDEAQQRRIRQLKGIERRIYTRMVELIVDELSSNGSLRTARGQASISRAVNEVFKSLDGDFNTLQGRVLADLGSIGTGHAAYFGEFGVRKFRNIRSRIDTKVRKRFGINKDGVPVSGGRVSSFFDSEALAKEVRLLIFRAVNAQSDVSVLRGQLDVVLRGNERANGAVVQQFDGLIRDVYAEYDRAYADGYAQELNLRAFVYQGGLIETSRQFCISRNNKVFTRAEAALWVSDTSLPGSSSGNYEPLIDMGRWNCRHRPRFISDRRAIRLRPELAEVLK